MHILLQTIGQRSVLPMRPAPEQVTPQFDRHRMIIWGGVSQSGNLNTGGRYSPGKDSWTAISTTNAPLRSSHTAVWTGTEMIVWGGAPSFLNTGGRYNPSTDNWTATSTTNAPTARNAHTAVWTDSEMIIWGGIGTPCNPSCLSLNTGGKYNPSADSWIATSIVNPPAGRAITPCLTGAKTSSGAAAIFPTTAPTLVADSIRARTVGYLSPLTRPLRGIIPQCGLALK